MTISRVLHRIVGRGTQDLAVESAVDKSKAATERLRERIAALNESCGDKTPPPRHDLHRSEQKERPIVRLHAIKA